MRRMKSILPLLLFVLAFNLPVTKGAIHGSVVETPLEAVSGKAEVHQILLVLEEKIRNPKALERAKEKLDALGEKQTRLIGNLCKRVKGSGGSAGADVSLLLMSILIILS